MDEVKNEALNESEPIKDEVATKEVFECNENYLYKEFEGIDNQVEILVKQTIESFVHYYCDIKFKERSHEFKMKVRADISMGLAKAFADNITKAPESISIEIKDYFEQVYHSNRIKKESFDIDLNECNVKKDEVENKMKDLQKEIEGKDLSKEEIKAKILERFPNAKFIIS